MKTVYLIALLVSLLIAPSVDARIQGAKGRRLEVYTSLKPYQDAVLVLKSASAESTFVDFDGVRLKSSPVDAAMLQRYTDQFLTTRLRRLAGPKLMLSFPTDLAANDAVMVASVRVIHQSQRWLRAGKVLVGIDLTDGRTGEVLASFSGFGRGGLRPELTARRDDLQEISRVFVDQLANALETRLPYRRSFSPRPYLRRPASLEPAPEMRRDTARTQPLPKDRQRGDGSRE